MQENSKVMVTKAVIQHGKYKAVDAGRAPSESLRTDMIVQAQEVWEACEYLKSTVVSAG